MSDSIFWFRRDLRLYDNKALSEALKQNKAVRCIFIFDKNILDSLPIDDRRITFIYDELSKIKAQLQEIGSDLSIYYDTPFNTFKHITETYAVNFVYTNHDYEPYAKERDGEIQILLNSNSIEFKTYKDQVVFEKNEVLTGSNTPYKVYSAYKKKWRSRLIEDGSNPIDSEHLKENEIQEYSNSFLKFKADQMLSLEDMGFKRIEPAYYPKTLEQEYLTNYDEVRNDPALDQTSRISVALRFGTVSVRKAVKDALKINQTLVDELIWRDFFAQILYHYPKVVNQPFKDKYKEIPWENDTEKFKKWCEGKTGFPIVDAGMRELNKTGFMHNRVRMITASFLIKDLLVDWRLGERYFAEKLMDYDLSSNNGNWQWVAGCGTDASPYFRIFNPNAQFKKFDPNAIYAKRWIEEYGTEAYPSKMLNHKIAREECLLAYKSVV